MNKTLLLIICDFLLLNLLALTHWEKVEPPRLPPRARPVAAAGLAPATAGGDLVAVMRQSLADEQARREQAAGQLEQREQEASRLAASLAETRQAAAGLEQKLSAATQEGAISKERLDQLQRDLEAREAEVGVQKERLAALEKQQAEAGQKIESLNVAVKVAEQEKLMLRENTDALRIQVAAEREERQKVQETAAQLAQGVDALADKSGELTKEIRDNRPVNANVLFSEFLANRVEAAFVAARPGLFGEAVRDREARTVFVSDGHATYALLHIDDTPFSLRESGVDWIRVGVQLRHGGARTTAGAVIFLARDPRLVALPVNPAQVAALGVKAYRVAAEPFKFPDAVLISNGGKGYGEVPFKLDAASPGYVRMDNRLMRRLFGDFSPSRGDLVLSRAGELLGVMVTEDYCMLVGDFQPAFTIPTGADLKASPTSGPFNHLIEAWRRLPFPLQ